MKKSNVSTILNTNTIPIFHLLRDFTLEGYLILMYNRKDLYNYDVIIVSVLTPSFPLSFFFPPSLRRLFLKNLQIHHPKRPTTTQTKTEKKKIKPDVIFKDLKTEQRPFYGYLHMTRTTTCQGCKPVFMATWSTWDSSTFLTDVESERIFKVLLSV